MHSYQATWHYRQKLNSLEKKKLKFYNEDQGYISRLCFKKDCMSPMSVSHENHEETLLKQE